MNLNKWTNIWGWGISKCSAVCATEFLSVVPQPSATIFSLFCLSACCSFVILSFSPPEICVSLKLNHLPPGLTLLFCSSSFCCQSDADEDSEMRTQVHRAHIMALLGASRPRSKMHRAAQNLSSVTFRHLSTPAFSASASVNTLATTPRPDCPLTLARFPFRI